MPPPAAGREALPFLWVKGLRAFADGFVSILLPIYLLQLGFDAFRVGVIATATLLGSALLTLLVGLVANRVGRHALLVGAGLLMAATGLGFAAVEAFWPLLLIAFVGTLNPSSGDVSVFLPLEHALLARTVADRDRTALFARYSLIGSVAAAFGALGAAFPEFLATATALSSKAAMQLMFAAYGVIGLVSAIIYRRVRIAGEAGAAERPAPLGRSRGIVVRLALLFSLDSFGGGFLVQSLLALWLYDRFALSLIAAGQIFFWTGVVTAFSYLIAVRIARRVGLINTMVFTHLPANLCLVAIPFVPDLAAAIALLLVRGLLSQMDVPTRTSYVMAVVTPEERAAAASITAVPRSLASAASPMLAGYLLGLSSFGWPLLIGGALKIVYDLLLLAMFRSTKPPEESDP